MTANPQDLDALVERLRKLADDMDNHATYDWDEHEDVTAAADAITSLRRQLADAITSLRRQLADAITSLRRQLAEANQRADAAEAAAYERGVREAAAEAADWWDNGGPCAEVSERILALLTQEGR